MTTTPHDTTHAPGTHKAEMIIDAPPGVESYPQLPGQPRLVLDDYQV